MWLSMIENKNQRQTSHCVQDVEISSKLFWSPSTDHFWRALCENLCIMGHQGSRHNVQMIVYLPPPPPIMLIAEPKMVVTFWTRNPISFTYASFFIHYWSHPNTFVKLRLVSKLGIYTLVLYTVIALYPPPLPNFPLYAFIKLEEGRNEMR